MPRKMNSNTDHNFLDAGFIEFPQALSIFYWIQIFSEDYYNVSRRIQSFPLDLPFLSWSLWHRNAFCATDSLWRQYTIHRWIPTPVVYLYRSPKFSLEIACTRCWTDSRDVLGTHDARVTSLQWRVRDMRFSIKSVDLKDFHQRGINRISWK